MNYKHKTACFGRYQFLFGDGSGKKESVNDYQLCFLFAVVGLLSLTVFFI